MADDNGSSGEAIAARLRDVLFSYERDADLVDADSTDSDDPGSTDPDERDGPVLRGVDLDVPAGEVVVVMGASGGGKSTLLRTLNALIPGFVRGSFDGDVEVLGRDATATGTSDLAEQVGTVMQDYEAQLFSTSVESEVAFGPENLAVPPEEIGRRIDRALELAGLEDLGRRREPAGLSGGQKQRLVFASVLAMQPELLVLDEPTSDLDPKGARDVVEIVRSLADGDEGPETIVLVTHEIEQALLADSAVLLKDGRLFRQGPTGEVFTDVDALRESRVELPPVVDAFDRLGWPEADLPVTVEEAADRVAEADRHWTPPEPSASAPAGSGGDPGEVRFEATDVRYSYETDRGSITAVDGVDLEIRDGEVVAIVGHNGSGKTTLAKQLNGLLEPDAGRVEWRGRDVREYDAAEVGREVGYVFQNPDHQIFESSVRDEVAFGPKNFGIEGDELDARVEDAIETVDLGPLADSDPFALSKGQRQRVALASILATRPGAIVFDEPTTGLDADQQASFMDLVARLNREEGLTVVMVTHDMGSVARYAPRTVVMADGRKVADRRTRELFADRDALDRWQLDAPQPVRLSNELARREGFDDPTPALTVEEVVDGLGGSAAGGESGNETDLAVERSEGGDPR